MWSLSLHGIAIKKKAQNSVDEELMVIDEP